MYILSSWLSATILLGLLLFGIQAGCWTGRKATGRYNELARSHVSSMRGSMLTILGLLLAFTFSQSLQRYDARSDVVVDEANAIGTAYLRAQLAPPAVRQRAQSVLSDYLDLRIRLAGMTLDDPKIESLLAEVQRMQAELWQITRQAAAEDDSPITSLFVQSINELIDAQGRREAEIRRHVPETVLLVLFLTFLLTVFVVGFSSGLDGDRPPLACYSAILVIVLSAFIILDLDHPRRGLIKVSHQSLINLQTVVGAKDSSRRSATFIPNDQVGDRLPLIPRGTGGGRDQTISRTHWLLPITRTLVTTETSAFDRSSPRLAALSTSKRSTPAVSSQWNSK